MWWFGSSCDVLCDCTMCPNQTWVKLESGLYNSDIRCAVVVCVAHCLLWVPNALLIVGGWSWVWPQPANGCAVCYVLFSFSPSALTLIVEWFLWTIEHTNRSLDNSNATFRPSRASSGIQYNKSKGGNLYTCAKGNDWSILCTSNDWSILCTSTQC